jgi:hypothetical protein
LTDTQVTLLESLDELAAQRSQVASLRNDRDNVLLALNSVRDSLDPSFPTFSLDSDDFLASVGTFTSTVSLRLPNQHLRAVEERDEYCIANKEYAQELRTLRAKHFASVSRAPGPQSDSGKPPTSHRARFTPAFT